VFVKYELVRSKLKGEGGKMVAARLAWGCLPEGARVPRSGVRVTHRWLEGGSGEQSFSQVVTKSGEAYSFAVKGKKVENLSVAMEMEGQCPAADGPHPLMLQAPKVEPRELADPKQVGPMREALKRLDESPTAETAADIMWNCASEMTRGVMPPALMAIGGEKARAELAKAVGKLESAKGCLMELLSFEGPAGELAAFLADAKAETRADAAALLARKGDRSAAAVLRAAAAKEEDPKALAAELAALMRLEGAGATAEAVKALPGLSERGRIRLGGELARAGAAEGLPALAEGMKSTNRYVRYEAARELAACGRTEAEPQLVAALADESRWVRREAIVGLAAVGGKACLKPLAAVAAKDPQPDLRGGAEWASGEVKKRR
jgi:HEAT repeat protein